MPGTLSIAGLGAPGEHAAASAPSMMPSEWHLACLRDLKSPQVLNHKQSTKTARRVNEPPLECDCGHLSIAAVGPWKSFLVVGRNLPS